MWKFVCDRDEFDYLFEYNLFTSNQQFVENLFGVNTLYLNFRLVIHFHCHHSIHFLINLVNYFYVLTVQ